MKNPLPASAVGEMLAQEDDDYVAEVLNVFFRELYLRNDGRASNYEMALYSMEKKLTPQARATFKDIFGYVERREDYEKESKQGIAAGLDGKE